MMLLHRRFQTYRDELLWYDEWDSGWFVELLLEFVELLFGTKILVLGIISSKSIPLVSGTKTKAKRNPKAEIMA